MTTTPEKPDDTETETEVDEFELEVPVSQPVKKKHSVPPPLPPRSSNAPPKVVSVPAAPKVPTILSSSVPPADVMAKISSVPPDLKPFNAPPPSVAKPIAAKPMSAGAPKMEHKPSTPATKGAGRSEAAHAKTEVSKLIHAQPPPAEGAIPPQSIPPPLPSTPRAGRARLLHADIEEQIKADTSRRPWLMLELAMACEREGNLSAAFRAIEDARRLSPEAKVFVRFQRGLAEAPNKKPTGLVDHHLRLATKAPERASVLCDLAEVAEDPAKSADLYRQALSVLPNDPRARRGLACALALAKPQANEVALALAELESSRGAHSLAGVLFEQLGEWSRAEQAYRAALEKAQKSADTKFPHTHWENYKRVLLRRENIAGYRDVLLSEAASEHDAARAVYLMLAAAAVTTSIGEQARAIQILEEAAKKSPVDPTMDVDVHRRLSNLLSATGHADLAVAHDAIILRYERDESMAAHLARKLGGDLEKLGDVEGSVAALRFAHHLDPSQLTTVLALDRLLARIDAQEDRLRLWLDEAARANTDKRRAEAYVRAARIAEDHIQDPKSAIEYLRAAWVTDTHNCEALDELTRLMLPPQEMVSASVHTKEGRSAKSLIELLASAVATTTDTARKIAYLEKAAALAEDVLGQPSRAAEFHRQVLQLDPSRRSAMIALARSSERASDFEGLAHAIELEISQTTDSHLLAELQLRAAHVWSARVGDHMRAATLIRSVLEKDSKNAKALREKLALAERAQRYTDVADTLMRLISVEERGQNAPTNFSLWMDLAAVQKNHLGKPDDAISSLRSALRCSPGNGLAQSELALSLESQSLFRELAELHEVAADKLLEDPTNNELAQHRLMESARVFERLKEDERALRTYRRVVGLGKPGELLVREALYACINICERKGLARELEDLFSTHLGLQNQLDPGFVASLKIGSGEVLFRHKKEDAATAILEEVTQSDPREVTALRMLDLLYTRNSKVDRKLLNLVQLLPNESSVPDKCAMLWDIGASLARQGRHEEALSAFNELYQLNTRDESVLWEILRMLRLRLAAGVAPQSVREPLVFVLRSLLAESGGEDLADWLEMELADALEDSFDAIETEAALRSNFRVLDRKPNSPTACAGVLRLAAALRNDEALWTGERARVRLETSPEGKASHLLRAAEAAYRVDQPGTRLSPNATELFLLAIETNPDSMEVADATIAHFQRSGDFLPLLDALSKAVLNAQDNAQKASLAMRAADMCEHLRDENPRVITLLTHALEHDPQHPQLLFNASKAYQKQGAFREAANALEVIANSKDPRAVTETKAQARRLLAEIFTGPLNDRQRAITELRQVRQLAPADTDSQRVLVDLLLPANAKEAEEICVSMVSSVALPAQLYACQKLAQLRLAQDDRPGAEAYMRQAVMLDPATDHEPFQMLERHFTRFGGDAVFVAVLQELSKKRVVPGWLAKLGVIETQRLGRIAEGLTHLRAAYEYASDDMTIAVAFLEALLAAGGNQDASQILGNLLPRYPAHLPLLEVAERNFMALGFREDAQVVSELSAFMSQHQIKIDALRSAHPPVLAAMPGDVEHIRNALIPPALTILPHHQILAALSDQLVKVFPPSLDAYGLSSRDRIAPRAQNPNRAWLDKALSLFGCEADLYFYRGSEARVIVENSAPPAILLPESSLQMIAAERLYLLARGVAKIALSAQLTDKFAPHDLTMLTYAGLWAVGHHAILPQNGGTTGYAIPDPDDASKRIARVLSRKARKMIEDVAPAFTGWDVREYLTIVERAIDRIAFVLTGNLGVSIDYIRKPLGALSPQQLLAPETPVGEFVRYALLPSTSGLRRRISVNQ